MDESIQLYLYLTVDFKYLDNLTQKPTSQNLYFKISYNFQKKIRSNFSVPEFTEQIKKAT